MSAHPQAPPRVLDEDEASATSADVHRRPQAPAHVLCVARYPVGGIRTFLKYTYGRLDPVKYRFTIAAVRFPEAALIVQDLAGFAVELHESDEGAGNRGLLSCTRRLLRQARFDLIHSQGLTAGILAILANWRTRCPHLITHHDVFRRDQFRGVAGRVKARLMAFLLARADGVVCVTADARRNFTEFLPSFPAAKLSVVPNGIDPLPFARAAERRRTRVPAAGDPFTFGFFGRFMPQKGFDLLIEAVAEMAGGQACTSAFRVLAVNEGDCIGRYRGQIRRAGLDDVFVFPGFRSSVADLLAEIDCVVMPSRWEAAGLLAMESLAAGCPLIASDCVGLREVVGGTPALVAKAGDSHSLARRMAEAVDAAPRVEAAFAAYAHDARDRFDVQRTALTTESLFARLMRPDLEPALSQ